VIRADYHDEVWATDSLARTVHEQEGGPKETGLLDANGRRLYAMVEMNPIGFVQFATPPMSKREE
ncbi:MAG: hypothetical protein ACTS5I_08050, partial [Rhodanobacter sp.]